MQPVPEYTNEEILERVVHTGIEPELQEHFRKCIEFHTYGAPGILLGVFMVDFGLELLGKTPDDKIFVTCETFKCLPDAPQVIMHSTVGSHRLEVLPIGRFALTMTPAGTEAYAEGVRIYLDRRKLDAYPVIAHWFDNSSEFRPEYMKRELTDAILTAGRDLFSSEQVRVKVPHKQKWHSAVCPSCGEQVPAQMMEGEICAGCGSLAYYERC